MQEWAKTFYQSRAWQDTRNAYLSSVHGLCERCNDGTPAEIVHHKTWLTRFNINDLHVSLDWANLEAVCRECHAIEHEGILPTVNGLRFDASGNIVYAPPFKK